MTEDERREFNLRALDSALERGSETADFVPPGSAEPPAPAPFRLTPEELHEAGKEYRRMAQKNAAPPPSHLIRTWPPRRSGKPRVAPAGEESGGQ